MRACCYLVFGGKLFTDCSQVTADGAMRQKRPQRLCLERRRPNSPGEAFKSRARSQLYLEFCWAAV